MAALLRGGDYPVHVDPGLIVTARELGRVIGKEKLLRLFFGPTPLPEFLSENEARWRLTTGPRFSEKNRHRVEQHASLSG